MQIDGGTVAGDDHAHTVMQASLDELARMRDLVSGGTLPGAARDLIAQIRGLLGRDRSPAAAQRRRRAHPRGRPTHGLRQPRRPRCRAGATPRPAAPATPSRGPPHRARSARVLAGNRAASQRGLAARASNSSSAPVLPGRESAPAERVEMARVDAELLDTMLNNAGEVSIFRARLDQQVNSIDFNLAELARTVTRLKEQLRGLEIETEAQVLNRHQNIEPRRDDFDPLELDRYSALAAVLARACGNLRATSPASRACSRL